MKMFFGFLLSTVLVSNFAHSRIEETVIEPKEEYMSDRSKDITERPYVGLDQKHTFLPPLPDTSPILNFNLQIPTNLKSTASRQIVVNQDVGNNYSAPVFMLCADPSEQCRGYEGDFEYSNLGVTVSQPIINDNYELEFRVGVFRLGDGLNDAVIQGFHEKILDDTHLSLENGTPRNRQTFTLTDNDQRTLDIKEGRLYVLPVKIGMNRYFNLKDGKNVDVDANVGISVSIPVEKITRSVNVGASFQIVRTQKITDRLNWLTAVGANVVQRDVVTVHDDTPEFYDNDQLISGEFTTGLSLQSRRFDGRWFVQLSARAMNELWDEDLYNVDDSEIMDESRDAFFATRYYATLHAGLHWKNNTLAIGFTEDILNTTYDPDFVVSISYQRHIKPWGRRKK